jgi:hypothetical protein
MKFILFRNIVRYVTACSLAMITSYGVHAKSTDSCSQSEEGANEYSHADLIKRVSTAAPGRISAGPMVSLRDEAEDICEAKKNCLLEGTSLLKAGVNGVEFSRKGRWICVGVHGKRKLDIWVGWLPKERWLRTESEQAWNHWFGIWQNHYAKIKIQSTKEQQMLVTGNAIWVGQYSPHFGNFELISAPINGVISTAKLPSESDCQIALRLVGSFIFAADNHQCGGANITFDGMYVFRSGLR